MHILDESHIAGVSLQWTWPTMLLYVWVCLQHILWLHSFLVSIYRN